EFVRGDHWDYRVLDARQAGDDKEAALVEMVQRMTPDGHFDYDAATYAVASARAYYDSYYPHYAVNFGYGWGWPYRYRYAALYSTCYDPFFYDPFLCYDPIFSRPYGYGFYGYGFYGYGYRPYYGGGYSFSNRPHNLFINRVRTGTGGQMYFKAQLGSNAAAGAEARVVGGGGAGAGTTATAAEGRAAGRNESIRSVNVGAGRTVGAQHAAPLRFSVHIPLPCTGPIADDRLHMTDLKRSLRLVDGLAMVVGMTVGAGIFRTPGIVAARLGRPGLTFVVWVLGAGLAFLGALCFAELTTR